MQFDIENLRKELDNLTIVTTDLEMEIEGLREEHILRKKDHEAVGNVLALNASCNTILLLIGGKKWFIHGVDNSGFVMFKES